MESMTQFVGERIRFFRKLKGCTMQELADAIGKSKSAVSKYENGEIAIDVSVLYDVAKVLQVSVGQLVDYPEQTVERGQPVVKSTFSEADTLFLYTYDGHSGQIVEGVIRIHGTETAPQAAMYFGIPAHGGDYHECRSFYQGTVRYHSAVINFVLNNQFNEMEQIFITLYNPLIREFSTPGMICGLTSPGMQPVATRCIVSLHRAKEDDVLRDELVFSRREQTGIKKLNALIIDNHLSPKNH